MISEDDAHQIVDRFLHELLEIDNRSIKALYIVGSLGGGYYRPGQSDIDTILILDSEIESKWGTFDKSSALLSSITKRYKKHYGIPKGFGAVAIAESELYPPYAESDDKSDVFAFEIARLKVQGKLRYGDYDLDSVPMPQKDILIRTALNFNDWFEKVFLVERPLEDLTLTESVNCLLGNIQGLLCVDSGIIEFNKFVLLEKAIEEYSTDTDERLYRSVLSYLHGEDSPPEIARITAKMEELRTIKVNRMRAHQSE